MSFDYFYGQQSDLFTFYRVPKVLFTNERFWNISADAKMLYGILLDRMSLSAKNGWIDKNGRVYIIFTIDEAKMALNCAEQKAIEAFSKERNDEYVGRAEEYKAAKSALLEGLGLEHLFDHSHELTPKEKEIWMLFDRVDVAELLARDAFAKGAYMLGAEDREIMLK